MGAKVLEYHGGVSYHGKSAVIDDRLTIVGSFNMDMKSAYQDTELMLVIDSRPLCEILKKVLLPIKKKRMQQTVQWTAKRNFLMIQPVH